METKNASKTESLSKHLASAWTNGEGVQPLTVLDPELSIDD